MTRAGRLDREITIQKKVVTQDPDYGTEVISWEPLSLLAGSPAVAERFAAEVMDTPPSRAEGMLRDDLVLTRHGVRIRMRWRDDLDSSMRVLLHGDGDDRILQIIGGPAEVGGRKQMTELMCEEISSQ